MAARFDQRPAAPSRRLGNQDEGVLQTRDTGACSANRAWRVPAGDGPQRILLLSYYFAPDFSAGAFRMEALVRALARRLPPGAELHVIATEPSRYSGAKAQPAFDDASLGPSVKVHRISARPPFLFQGAQLWSFQMYARAALGLAREIRPDLVVASSSRLGTGLLGGRIARKYDAPLHLDLRDLFLDAAYHLLPAWIGRVASPSLNIAEHSAIASARTVSVTSPSHQRYLDRAYGKAGIRVIPNGIDTLFQQHKYPAVYHRQGEPLRVLYAGNLGLGQSLHLVLPELAARTRGRVQWRIVGDGAQRQQLAEALARKGVDNVELIHSVPRARLLDHYDWANVLFLHLAPKPAMRRVVPSKIFEYAATGRPILAGFSGISARLLHHEVDGAHCFRPGDVDDAMRALDALEVRSFSRTVFRARYTRECLALELADLILGEEQETRRPGA